MPSRAPQETLEHYEEEAVAHYFAHEAHFPYISVTLISLVAAWLMWQTATATLIVIWLAFGSTSNLLRELFLRYMRPRLAQPGACQRVVQGMTVAALLNGLTWGAFSGLYFDASDPLTLLLLGFYLAGLVGGAVTPLSIFPLALYAFLLPALLPYMGLMLIAGTPTHYMLAGLTLLFMLSNVGYARLTNRLHRESIRLRWENKRVIRDLELRQADAEAAWRTKSLFLAGVSHDLKQPMRAIALYGAYLRHQSGDNTVVVQTATKIETAVGEVQGQIERLLELSRLQSGTLQLNPQALDLSEVFEHLRTMFSEEALAKGIQLRLARPRGQRVWCDRVLLLSVLQNLLDNAIKNTERGAVYVGTRLRARYPPQRRLCIEVRDSGIGVSAMRLPLLFDAYQSFDDRSASESHGLGLAIAKAQAINLGCEIAVNSAPTRGSTFTLCGLLKEASPGYH
jgi:signal transduction histidine kinase